MNLYKQKRKLRLTFTIYFREKISQMNDHSSEKVFCIFKSTVSSVCG